MLKLFQENLDLRQEDLVAGLLDACDIRQPPTDEQLVFDFLKLGRDLLPSDLVTKFASTFRIDPKIRALLDLKDRLVLVHPNLIGQQERYTWASLHEVGHYVLPDHRELLYKCSWHDLSHWTQKRLETEANRFAADLIFQNDVFTEEAAGSALSMKIPLSLRDRYRTSFEATIRRYVEKNPSPCALVVYRPTDTNEFEPPLEVQYSVRSRSWSYFAYLIPHQKSLPESPESRVFHRKEGDREITEAELRVGNDDRTSRVFPTQLFSNTYRVFQLVHPPTNDP
jgi:hypothetical protein